MIYSMSSTRNSPRFISAECFDRLAVLFYYFGSNYYSEEVDSFENDFIVLLSSISIASVVIVALLIFLTFIIPLLVNSFSISIRSFL